MDANVPRSLPKRPAARRGLPSAAAASPAAQVTEKSSALPKRHKRPRTSTPTTATVASGARDESRHAAAAPEYVGAQAHLYEAQRNLDQLLQEVDHVGDGTDSRRRAVEALGRIASQLGGADDAGSSPVVQPLLREVFSLESMARRVSRYGMRHRSDEVDDFGLDREFEGHIRPLLAHAFEKYFRVQVSGAQHIPKQGRALLVCNRGGALPVDGLLLKTAVAKHCQGDRELRWLIEDFNFHAPFVGSFLNRVGAVRACQENAQRLLAHEALVAVFPEGIKGVSKLYRKRYQLQRFGRGGYVKLALRMGAPMIPAAIVGPEDAYPILYRLGAAAKATGLPFLPVTPTFPWLGPLGLLPLPSRSAIVFGPPIAGLADYGPEAADDTVLVNEINERVRNTVQSLVDDARKLRGSRVYS